MFSQLKKFMMSNFSIKFVQQVSEIMKKISKIIEKSNLLFANQATGFQRSWIQENKYFQQRVNIQRIDCCHFISLELTRNKGSQVACAKIE